MPELFDTEKGSPQENGEIAESEKQTIDPSQLEGLGLLDFEQSQSKDNLEASTDSTDTSSDGNSEKSESPKEAKDDSERMEYWQSKADKLQAELNKKGSDEQDMAIYSPIIKAIKEHPDILNQLEDRVNGTTNAPEQKDAIAIPAKPAKPKGYDPSEAVNDPDSQSWKYREDVEEYRDLMDQHREKVEMSRIDEVRRDGENRRQAQLREANLNVLKYEYGWTPQQINEFEKTMMNPQNYNVHNLARYYTFLSDPERQKKIENNKKAEEMGQRKKIAKLPNMPETATGQGSPQLSDADMFNLGLLQNKRR